jgi:hypothetical protein
VILLVALLIWRPWNPAPPRLNEQPYKIAKFAASSSMDRLPWSQQREYMDILADKDNALLEAYKQGKLSDTEYRRALQLGWYDKHLDRMDKYFNRPPMMRTMYIDEKVLGKKVKKNHPGVVAPGKKPKPPKDEEKSDDLSPLKAEEIDRDNSTEEQDIKKWPPDVRSRWSEYRTALAARKEFFKELERQEKEKKKHSAEAAADKAGATGNTSTKASPAPADSAAPEPDKAAGAQ